MALLIKALNDGQLAASKGTLYTAPGSTRTVAKVVLVNSDGSARTVNLYVNRTGSSRRISPVNMSLGAGEQYVSQVVTLEAADIIEGDASAATVVDFTIHGFEVA
jgi:hypothetical protein